MSGIWGNNIKLSIFGESHGTAVGITIDGLKAGIELDIDYINNEMKRRAPGNSMLATERKESDSFKILSGYFNGKTTGTPLCAIIYNTDQRSKDYESSKSMPRPSHGDYTGFIKYGGFNDYRGGGHFSGRLTAPLVFAGSICRKLLEQEGIIIGSHVKSIGSIEDSPFDLAAIDKDLLEKLRASSLPLIDASKEEEVRDAIIKAKSENDSLGGVIETAIINVKPGIGNPFFDSVESILAHLMFSIPGVKGIEFGAGFNISRMTGSQANDEFYAENNFVRTYTNNNGGILGGITNGMPIVFRVAFKPTASIGKAQRTIDMEKLENTVMELKGRHDPCIVPRAVPVVEAMAAIGMLDLML